MLAAKLTRLREEIDQRCLQVLRERLRPILGGCAATYEET